MEVLNGLRQVISVLAKNSTYIITVLFAVATALFFVLNLQISRVLKVYRGLLKGTQGENVEGILRELVERMGRMGREMDDLRTFIEDVHAASQQHLQGVGIVRFNAFDDTGGSQSYAIALLDGKGDGVVLSSLYGRDESRTYAKPIIGGSSQYSLSKEEEAAIRQALTLEL